MGGISIGVNEVSKMPMKMPMKKPMGKAAPAKGKGKMPAFILANMKKKGKK